MRIFYNDSAVRRTESAAERVSPYLEKVNRYAKNGIDSKERK